jgi:hypothetical protein
LIAAGPANAKTPATTAAPIKVLMNKLLMLIQVLIQVAEPVSWQRCLKRKQARVERAC